MSAAVNDLFSTIGKTCCACNRSLPFSAFYSEKKKKYGLTSRCRECQNTYARKYYNDFPERNRETRRIYSIKTRDVAKKRSAEWYYSIHGKARTLLGMARSRSRERGWETDLDTEFLEGLLSVGKCSVTGIPFQYSASKDKVKNPFVPSLDRIDSAKPYIKTNVRIVIWQYNLMKGEMSDAEILEICKRVINHADT